MHFSRHRHQTSSLSAITRIFTLVFFLSGCFSGDSTPEQKIESLCYDELNNESCGNLAPAPTSSAAINSFIQQNAYPLKCDKGTDLSAISQLFGKDNQVFMMGEVHGTNEIGIMSEALFEYLVKNNGVNTLAFEGPMDFQESFQNYVETGIKDTTFRQFSYYFAENMFINILTEKARELHSQGYPIQIALVDFSYGTETPIKKIKEVAQKLSTYKNMVLTNIPDEKGPFDEPNETYANQTIAYTDTILDKINDICSELNDADCDKLTNMTHALWVAVAIIDMYNVYDEWFARREFVIYYNLRSYIKDASSKTYMHMGAFHTNKWDSSAGSRLAQEYEVTRNKVISLTAAWGDGSEIFYQYEMEIPAEPEVINDALKTEPNGPYFISSTLAGIECTENPLSDMILDKSEFYGTMSQLYDGAIYFRQLTPESRPDDSTLTLNKDLALGKRILEKWDYVHELERAYLSQRRK